MIIKILFACLFLAKILHSQSEFDIGKLFVPAGYMGCYNNISLHSTWKKTFYSGPHAFRIAYTSNCEDGYAGIHWTNKSINGKANWGTLQGNNLSGKGYIKLVFMACGEKGGEVIEFGMGGIGSDQSKYKDSHHTHIQGRTVELTKEWKQYIIDLSKVDLSSVISGFYWSAGWSANPTGVVFYLDDIKLIKP